MVLFRWDTGDVLFCAFLFPFFRSREVSADLYLNSPQMVFSVSF